MKPPKGAVVFIYGAPMDIPQTEPPLVRRQRAMAHRVVTDPNLLVISKRLMTQGQIWKIPENYDKVSIFGEPEVRRSQAIALLTLYNPQLPIKRRRKKSWMLTTKKRAGKAFAGILPFAGPP